MLFRSSDQLIKKFQNRYFLRSFFISKNSIYDDMQNATVVFGSVTTALVEGLKSGIPAIVLGNRNGITQNPIPSRINNEIWRLCYTNEEIQLAIEYFINLTFKQKRSLLKIGELIQKEYFEIVDKESVNLLLN